jgi:hypothetical protein
MENYLELASIAEFVNQAAYTSGDSYKNLNGFMACIMSLVTLIASKNAYRFWLISYKNNAEKNIKGVFKIARISYQAPLNIVSLWRLFAPISLRV